MKKMLIPIFLLASFVFAEIATGEKIKPIIKSNNKEIVIEPLIERLDNRPIISMQYRDGSELFFSEYAEGSSNHKYMEIYNPTSETIDLSGYAFANVRPRLF